MLNKIISASVKIGPVDSRCRYWAKIIRANTALPMPSDANCAASIPGAYLRNGEDELFFGDIMIEGEENHHRRARGWRYLITYCGADGNAIVVEPGADEKAALKSAGLPAEYLPGSGGIAACVRYGCGVRLGLVGVAARADQGAKD